MAYALAGLKVVSEIALPGVAQAENSAPRDVAIRLTQVPESLDTPIATFPEGTWDGQRLLIVIGGVARFLVSPREIDVEPEKGSDMGDVRAFLLGTVFGALCHLRGILPFHASAVDFEGRCIAFTGDSGAGKSTMVAALTARGHNLITDDVTYIRPDESGALRVWLGLSRLRLWESAMEGLGIDKQGVERELRGYDKFLLPAARPEDTSTPLQLSGVYQLEAAQAGSEVRIERMRGAAAIELLLENVYRLHLGEHVGQKTNIFAFCTRLARDVPVFRLSRPKDFSVLGTVVDTIERHLREGAVAR